jgi:hypothetical protein
MRVVRSLSTDGSRIWAGSKKQPDKTAPRTVRGA